jgi:hypothetical protein
VAWWTRSPRPPNEPSEDGSWSISAGQEACLRALHDQFPTRRGHWAQHLEGSYPPTGELRTLRGLGRRWLYIDHGWREMRWSAHCNTEVVRWSLRECGITLAGPGPRTLVDEIPAGVLRARMRTYAQEFLPELFTWTDFSIAWTQRYAVTTFCRILHTIESGRVTPRPAPVRSPATRSHNEGSIVAHLSRPGASRAGSGTGSRASRTPGQRRFGCSTRWRPAPGAHIRHAVLARGRLLPGRPVVKGDKVEIVIDAGGATRTYEVAATRAGRRVEVVNRRGVVEVTEVTRGGAVVRTARFMASRVLALVEHPAPRHNRRAGSQGAE